MTNLAYTGVANKEKLEQVIVFAGVHDCDSGEFPGEEWRTRSSGCNTEAAVRWGCEKMRGKRAQLTSATARTSEKRRCWLPSLAVSNESIN